MLNLFGSIGSSPYTSFIGPWFCFIFSTDTIPLLCCLSAIAVAVAKASARVRPKATALINPICTYPARHRPVEGQNLTAKGRFTPGLPC